MPAYRERLSKASQMSLAEQGGPLGPDDTEAFAAGAFAAEAIRLRAYDDVGKVDGLKVDGGAKAPLETYRGLIAAARTQICRAATSTSTPSARPHDSRASDEFGPRGRDVCSRERSRHGVAARCGCTAATAPRSTCESAEFNCLKWSARRRPTAARRPRRRAA